MSDKTKCAWCGSKAHTNLQCKSGIAPSLLAQATGSVSVRIDLEEMQKKLSTAQQAAMIDGVGEILKASSLHANHTMRPD